MPRSIPQSVFGVSARRPRPTARGALWLATLLSLPVFAVLSIVEVIWRVVFP